MYDESDNERMRKKKIINPVNFDLPGSNYLGESESGSIFVLIFIF